METKTDNHEIRRGVTPGNDARSFRLAIDIGGTFTDAVLVDELSGKISINKVLSTPDDPSEGFIECIQRLRDQVVFEPAQLYYVIHGTTVATNAILERSGARAAMLVTEGFRDLLEIGRQIRHELYNLQTEKPKPIIPREHCLELPERINHNGEIVKPLQEKAVLDAIKKLKEESIESIAVCLLHSYRNPSHEQLVADIIRRLYPQVRITLSSEIAPEIREYWRASTAAINAYVAPNVATYLEAIEKKLEDSGINTNLHIMKSSGGLMTVARAKQHPVYMLESGPAAGVIAAVHFAKLSAHPNVISFDMGGTTAKMGLILDGEPRVVPEFEAGGVSGTGVGVAIGSGYPILAPVMDLVEVGAGGGSIAWIDAGNLMRVGPESAGADPGPACYGMGGTKPTVTDANLILGRLNPDYFLGGEIQLDVEAALHAIELHSARPLNIDVTQAAMGILDISNATMNEVIRLVSVQRGLDPREFCLFASGGAGPVHANQLADELGIPTIIVPPSPGTGSALGMLVSDMRHDYRLTRLELLDSVNFDEINAIFCGFESKAIDALTGEGMAQDQIRFERYLEMRYVGQSFNLKTHVPHDDLRGDTRVRLKKAFDSHHKQLYGYAVPEERVEIVNIGLLAVGVGPKPRLKEIPLGGSSAHGACKESRQVYFRESGGFLDCLIFDRNKLCQNNLIKGPAVIEEMDSTTIIHPGYTAEVGFDGVLILRKAK